MSYLKHFESHDILISATRYYLGRRTIQAAYHARCLAKAWNDLPRGTQSVIRRDLEEAFEQDDAARAEGRDYKPLGMDCDRGEWELVRKQWGGGGG